MRARTTLTAVVAGALATVLLAGCGDDAEGRAEPTPSASAPATTASPSPTEEPEKTEDPVPVATGPVLRMPSAEVTMPAGWKKLNQLAPALDTAQVPQGIGIISLTEVDSFDDSTNDELARLSKDQRPEPGEIKQLPDVEIDGVAMYHLVHKPGSKAYRSFGLEEFGTVYDDQVVRLVLELDQRKPEAERQAIRDQVLASFRWK